jgi:hypothetical protein
VFVFDLQVCVTEGTRIVVSEPEVAIVHSLNHLHTHSSNIPVSSHATHYSKGTARYQNFDLGFVWSPTVVLWKTDFFSSITGFETS